MSSPDRRLWWLGLPAAIIGLFVVALDQSLTGVASTSIGNTLGASTIDTQWVTTVNRVGRAVAIPAAAWLCRCHGLRPVYVAAMLLHTAFSVGCAFASDLWTLAALRFLEGIPGGIVAIAAIGILITTVPMPMLTAMISIELAAAASFIPTFLKSVQGLSATDAGLVTIPQAVVSVIAVVCAQTLTRKWGLRQTMATGLPLLALGDLLLSRLTVDTPRPLPATILAVRAVGLGLAFVPILSGATSRPPMALMPDAIQFRTIIQRVVGAVLVTGLVQLANHRQRQILDDRSGLLAPADQPSLYAQDQGSPDALVSLWNQLKFPGTAQSYSEIFLVAALLAVAGIVVGSVTRWGAPPDADDVVLRDGA